MSQIARAVQADAALYGRLDRKDGQLVLQPILLDVQGGQTKWLLPMTMADVDLVTHVIAHYTLGSVHLALKNRWKAAAQFHFCIRLDPSMPEPYKAIGDLLLGAPRGLFDMAIEAYSRAITLRPFYAEAYVGLGDARRAKGDLDDALAAYRAAATFDPFNPLTYLKLGTIYRQRALCADAVGAFTRALALDPSSADAQKSLAAISGTSCH